ncbi:hypothetical protein [Sphingomonas sp. ID0503]|uniref:hypothetical protein n=1 Tax=Sphingomonas sp. ID0503 TaxID=3399691 RepID=UPI003AFABD34
MLQDTKAAFDQPNCKAMVNGKIVTVVQHFTDGSGQTLVTDGQRRRRVARSTLRRVPQPVVETRTVVPDEDFVASEAAAR